MCLTNTRMHETAFNLLFIYKTMDNTFWNKITNYKLFGHTIFSKEEICQESQYEGQIYQIEVKKDYFDSEFNLNKKKDNNDGRK